MSYKSPSGIIERVKSPNEAGVGDPMSIAMLRQASRELQEEDWAQINRDLSRIREQQPGPPRHASMVLWALLPIRSRELILGCLEEEYRKTVAIHGERWARWTYIADATKSLVDALTGYVVSVVRRSKIPQKD